MKVMEPVLANLALQHKLIFVLATFKRLLTPAVFVQECGVVDVFTVFVLFVVEKLT